MTRQQSERGVYHVMSRGIDRRNIFLDFVYKKTSYIMFAEPKKK